MKRLRSSSMVASIGLPPRFSISGPQRRTAHWLRTPYGLGEGRSAPCGQVENGTLRLVSTLNPPFFRKSGKIELTVFVADRWFPEIPSEGHYIWLPVDFQQDGRPCFRWRGAWHPDFRANPMP